MYLSPQFRQCSFFSPSFRTQVDFAPEVSRSAKLAHSHRTSHIAVAHRIRLRLRCRFVTIVYRRRPCSLSARCSHEVLAKLCFVSPLYLVVTYYLGPFSSSVAPADDLALPSASDQAVVRSTHHRLRTPSPIRGAGCESLSGTESFRRPLFCTCRDRIEALTHHRAYSRACDDRDVEGARTEYLGQSLAGWHLGRILRVTMPGARKRSRCGERLVILDNNSGARRRPAARECKRRYGARVGIGLSNILYANGELR